MMIRKEQAKVAVVKVDDLESSLLRALKHIGGLEKLVKSSDRILIKPNFGIPMNSETGATTDPRLVVAFIKALKDRGCAKVMVGESAVCGFNAGAVMQELDVIEMIQKAGAEVLNLDGGEFKTRFIKVPDGKILKKIEIYEPALECDVLISVPVMKTHIYAGVSLGMKNLKGSMPDRQKKMFHRTHTDENPKGLLALDQCIFELMKIHRPSITILDGIVAQEGFKIGMGIMGNPVPMGVLVAGAEPVSTDAVGAYLMGFDPLSIGHIKYCHEAGLGCADMEQIKTLGDYPGSLRRKFKPAVPGQIEIPGNIEILEGGSCSGCSFAIRWLFNSLGPDNIRKMPALTFVVGQHDLRPEFGDNRHILLGNCACQMKNEKSVNIKGCPPPYFQMMEVLRKGGVIPR